MLEDILLQVSRPGQYIGGEWNLPKKDFDKAGIKFALCFPDLYEVGMSNLGIKIIYGILNNLPDVSCERFFSCNQDMEEKLRSERLGIFSLESKRKLKDFDIAGFSLASELNYTNVLNILELGSIPLKSNNRDQSHPLIIGGGPSTMNPEPMHEFFDLFVIGEAEDLILELVDVYGKNKKRFKEGSISKDDLLYLFAQIEGVYVPSFYEPVYKSQGLMQELKPKIKGIPAVIKKRYVLDLDAAYFPLEWLVPYVPIIHDRITLEIMRGCPNRCRFCQARSQYFPLRFRRTDNILSLADKLYKCTGYEELSLAGLSVSEYPGIQELLKQLLALFSCKAVGISLPSVKAKAGTGSLSSLIASVKKTGLTFAPEAGSEKMRKILAKDFDEADFFNVLKEAYSAGYQHVKLYFMIGLPGEDEKDLDGIIDFSTRVSELKRSIDKRPARVNISVNTFIPKPHTALQWFEMESAQGIKNKQDYLRSRAKNKRLIFNFHNNYMSFLEGVFSRGDRRLSEVILLAFRKGARFDAWSNHFAFEIWQSAFGELGIDPYIYLRQRQIEEYLPWNFIDIGFDREILFAEFNKVIARE